jgi:hypothetical protein
MYCIQCGCQNHNVQECHLWKKYCNQCGKLGHLKKDCWDIVGRPNKCQNDKADEDQSGSSKRMKREDQVHVNEEITDEIIMFGVEENKVLYDSKDEYNVNTANPNDEGVLYYGWLANCAMTSHVTNQCKGFVTYQQTNNTTIAGVGNM